MTTWDGGGVVLGSVKTTVDFQVLSFCSCPASGNHALMFLWGLTSLSPQWLVLSTATCPRPSRLGYSIVLATVPALGMGTWHMAALRVHPRDFYTNYWEEDAVNWAAERRRCAPGPGGHLTTILQEPAWVSSGMERPNHDETEPLVQLCLKLFFVTGANALSPFVSLSH